MRAPKPSKNKTSIPTTNFPPIMSSDAMFERTDNTKQSLDNIDQGKSSTKLCLKRGLDCSLYSLKALTSDVYSKDAANVVFICWKQKSVRCEISGIKGNQIVSVSYSPKLLPIDYLHMHNLQRQKEARSTVASM